MPGLLVAAALALLGCGDGESIQGGGGGADPAGGAPAEGGGGSPSTGGQAQGAGGGGGSDLPDNPGPGGLYLGVQPDLHPTVTPKDEAIVWGAAPPIDPSYGGTLYGGTAGEMEDPRPPLVDGREPLQLFVAEPGNDLEDRPAILWFHGGGFAVGITSMHGLANTTGREYASRGYVGFSVEYRIDTTMVGDKSLCQWVQDNEQPGDPTWESRKEQCRRNILAAQYDALAAVRWVRAHAAQYRIDPGKIAIGGFSAGAVTASNTAYQGEQVGDDAYFEGDDRSAAASVVQAAFGASGCTYGDDGGPPTTIGAGDAPVSLIHSELDQAVPYACAAATVETARAAGLVAELTSYCGQGGHANDLYDAHKDVTDVQWTTFLTRELHIYGNMPDASAEPVCPP